MRREDSHVALGRRRGRRREGSILRSISLVSITAAVR
jgi:hypothetical protein